MKNLTFVYTVYTFTPMITATLIAFVIATLLVALAVDARQSDIHSLRVRRLYRKIKKVQRANELTELDCMYYRQHVSK